jgi:hypothetical protein
MRWRKTTGRAPSSRSGHRLQAGHWIGVSMLAVIAFAVSGCSGPAAGIVDRIRAAQSSVIQEVRYSPANGLIGEPDEVYIYFVPTVTDAQVADAWCSVVVPAGIEQLPSDTVWLAKAGVVEAGDVVVGSSGVIKPTCGQS